MPEKVTKEKVLVYVVRDGRLLVFRHTDYSYEEVGIQVPAGSIRPGAGPGGPVPAGQRGARLLAAGTRSRACVR
ncbi:hypothetical protein ACWEO1_40455, partial [Kitasatospora cineracea]